MPGSLVLSACYLPGARKVLIRMAMPLGLRRDNFSVES